MKKMFLRRFLAMALCMLMVLPMFMFNVGAANNSLTAEPGDKSIIGTERQNWGPNGQGYHTSTWNNDRHSKYLVNGTYNHSYQYWEPSDPARPNGNGVDPTKQHVGFSFYDGYYLLDEIIIYAGEYDKGYNNIKYTVEALILGEWVQVGIGCQDDGVPSEYDGISKISIKLEHPKAAEGEDVNTNNIRIWCSEYGYYAKRYGDYANKPATTHDWWLVPRLQEVEIMGVTGYRPEFDVPLNAYLVHNAALSGMIGATSSAGMRYPLLAGDEDLASSWKVGGYCTPDNPQSLWAEFNKEYPVDNVGFNVGGVKSADTGVILTYNVYILTDGTVENGTWEQIVTGATATTTTEMSDYIIHDLGGSRTIKGFKIEFTSAKNASGQNKFASVSELWSEISDGGKCIFLADYITTAKKLSSATGNLACYGTAYASSNFAYAGISNVANIIDGEVSYASKGWIAADYLKDTYVGVTLKEAHDVTKVVLYFPDVLGGNEGEHVFKVDVQAKVDGEFVTIKTVTSYDAAKKSYIVSVAFDEAVYTDDIRVVFKSDAQTFPYLKELEVFEEGFIYSSFDGYSLDQSRVKGGPAATNEFGARTVAQRGKYFNKLSPIEYFNIALEHDVQIDWLG